MLFWKYTKPELRERIDGFFEKLKTPIDPIKEKIPDTDRLQYNRLGKLCIIYGGFVFVCDAYAQGLYDSNP